MHRSWRAATIVLAAVAAAPSEPVQAQAPSPWWNAQWRYRRAVSVPEVPATGLPGDEIAVATIYTGGLCRTDARDVRVVGRTGGLRPMRVLMKGPGDRLRIAFGLAPGVLNYFIYFGNGQAPRPQAALDLPIRRGVLMEAYPYSGRGGRDPAQVRQMIDRSTRVYGRTFLPNIFLGHDPFGPGGRMIARYTATLIAPVAGRYTFAITSTDASFLAIDGEDLIRRLGPRWPERDVRHQATVELTRGPHTLELLHVSASGVPVAVAAWQAPGEKRVWTIPPQAFAPVVTASPGLLAERGQSVTADFDIAHAGEAFIANRYYQRYIFRELVSLGPAPNPKFHWDLGDGQTSEAAVVEHVYLNNGLHDVKLTVTVGRRTYTRTHRLYVTRNWETITRNRLDRPEQHARIVAAYDPDSMRGSDFAPAVALLERTGNVEAILAIGQSLIAHAAAAPDALREVLPKVTRYWRQQGRGEHAVAALLGSAKAAGDTRTAAVLTVLAGQILLRDLSRPEQARKLFEQTIARYADRTGDEAIRAARIGIGDTWRCQGDYARAKAAYRQVPTPNASFESRMLRRGGYARHVEEYLRTGALEDAETYLDRWEDDLPADRLTGYSTLMRVRLRLKQQRWADAAVEALTLVAVNPESNYAPQLLLEAEEAYRKLDQPEKARQMLQRLCKEYPESALTREARKRLGEPTEPQDGN